MSDEWQVHAARLADELTAAGKLHSPEWQAAIRAVPRHLLVPASYHRDGDGWVQCSNLPPTRWPGVYSNTALFTAMDATGTPSSSSSQPSLMTRMLEMLTAHDRDRVLEIGTATGYNAALLAHRLGDANVFSVDIDADLVNAARERLARLGYRPTLVAADGAAGLPPHAPFARIIATCSVPQVPWPWVEQVVDGGMILVNVQLATSSGNLVLLRKHGDRADGHFDSGYAAFMAMRHNEPATQAPHQAPGGTRERTTALPAFPWKQPVPWFLTHAGSPQPITYGHRFDADTGRVRAGLMTTPNGSWLEIALDPGGDRRRATSAGATDLLTVIERGFALWTELGCPTWQRLGWSATKERQWLWLDEPGNRVNAPDL